MLISDGMQCAAEWMLKNNVDGDPKKLKFHSIRHLLSKFADDHNLTPKSKHKNYVINGRCCICYGIKGGCTCPK